MEITMAVIDKSKVYFNPPAKNNRLARPASVIGETTYHCKLPPHPLNNALAPINHNEENRHADKDMLIRAIQRLTQLFNVEESAVKKVAHARIEAG